MEWEVQRVLKQVLLQRWEVVRQGHVVLAFGEGSRFSLNSLPLSHARRFPQF